MRSLLALALALLALSASASSPSFDDERSKQNQIYQSREAERPEGYVIGRSLLSYSAALPPEFVRTLSKLGAEDRWLDVGAGEGRAVLDYSTAKYDVMLQAQVPQQPRGKAQAIALSLEDRRTRQWHEAATQLGGKQIDYRFGKSLRDYSLEELGGQFDVITDVFGGFSYTQNLSDFMEKTLRLLEVNGTFYSVLQDVRWEQGENKPFYEGSPFLTQLVKPDGSDMKICSYLKSIGCAEVTCETKEATPPVEMYRVKKVCENVTVPKTEMVHFQAGTPPERRFKLAQ